MMLLHLRVDADAFRQRSWRIAEDEGLATWPGATAGSMPGVQVVELGVGDATLAFTPEEVARIVGRLVN